MSFVPLLGVGLLCSMAAANAPPADTRSARFFQNVVGQPFEALKAPFEQLLGRQANRFNLNGPLRIVADTVQKFKETTNVSSLLHLQELERLGFDTAFSVFGNGEGLKCAKEAFRHTTDAILRVPEMTARAFAHFSKTTDHTLAVSSEKISKVLTHLRTMILPNIHQAAF
jgi:hypothetical protein